MKNDLLKIIQAIRNNIVISIKYDNGNEDYYRRIHPYYIFFYKDNVYLLARHEKHTDITTYKMSKIRGVETTSLFFNEIREPIIKYLRNTVFNLRYIEPLDINDNITDEEIITRISKKDLTDYTKHSRLERILEYYIKSLKYENLMEISIDAYEKSSYFIIDSIQTHKLLNSRDVEVQLNSNFKYIFTEWDKIIRSQPDLIMYMGYPYFECNKKFIPLLYYATVYDPQNNTLKLQEGSVGINGSFINEDLELTREEADCLIADLSKIEKKFDLHIFEKLNTFGKEILEQYTINENGILFLDINRGTTKNLIRELNDFKLLKEADMNIPLKCIIEGCDLSRPYSKMEHIYHIVSINDSQANVIKNSDRNLTLVQGPPGTGKTQTIINLIANEVIKGHKVLISSTNNKALDNIIEKIKSKDAPLFTGILRLGNYEHRNQVLDEISELFKQSFPKIENSVILELQDNSKRLQKEIDIRKKALDEIYNLELTQNELTKAFIIQEKELISRNIDVNTYIKVFREGILSSSVTCINIINNLNNISLLCEVIDQKRFKWYWRFLIGRGFDFDTHFIKKINKKVEKCGISKSFIDNSLNIDEFNYKINQLISFLQYYSIKTALKEVEGKIKELDKEKTINELNTLDKNKMENDLNLLNSIYKNTLSSIKADEKTRLLNHLEQRSENSFNQDDNVYDILLKAFPVIVTTSLSVSKSAPPDKIFDLSIIDEASQCNIPSSLPVIKRSKRLIIVGDNKQLNPVIKLDNIADQENLDKYDLKEYASLYSFANNSAFDIVERIINVDNKYLLDEHYRCHPEVIDFANRKFYDNKLKVKTEDKKGDYYGMRAINVESKVSYRLRGSKSAFNLLEADALINYLLENYKLIKDKSIGIITPFRKQREELNQKLATIRNRILDVGMKEFLDKITVGTVHTFQGDEKQLIFFSPVISEGIRESTVKWVNENKNLINVAITRAKECFIMIGNINYIKRYEGLLKDLVNYIESLGYGIDNVNLKNIFNVYKIVVGNKYSKAMASNSIRSLLNKGEEAFYNMLKSIISQEFPNFEIGIKVRVADILNVNPNMVNREYFKYSLNSHFDFVLFDKTKNTLPVVAIELDGKFHQTDTNTIVRDGMKNDLCRVFGLPIERISTREYLNEKILKDMITKYYISTQI